MFDALVNKMFDAFDQQGYRHVHAFLFRRVDSDLFLVGDIHVYRVIFHIPLKEQQFPMHCSNVVAENSESLFYAPKGQPSPPRLCHKRQEYLLVFFSS